MNLANDNMNNARFDRESDADKNQPPNADRNAKLKRNGYASVKFPKQFQRHILESRERTKLENTAFRLKMKIVFTQSPVRAECELRSANVRDHEHVFASRRWLMGIELRCTKLI